MNSTRASFQDGFHCPRDSTSDHDLKGRQPAGLPHRTFTWLRSKAYTPDEHHELTFLLFSLQKIFLKIRPRAWKRGVDQLTPRVAHLPILHRISALPLSHRIQLPQFPGMTSKTLPPAHLPFHIYLLLHVLLWVLGTSDPLFSPKDKLRTLFMSLFSPLLRSAISAF